MQLLLLLTFVLLNLLIVLSFSLLEILNRRLLIYLYIRLIELLINLFFVKFAIDFTKLQKSIDNHKFIKILFQNRLFRQILTTIRRQAILSFQIDFTFVYHVFLIIRRLFFRQLLNQLSFRRLFRKTFSILMSQLTILSIILFLTIIYAIYQLYQVDKNRVLRSNNEMLCKF